MADLWTTDVLPGLAWDPEPEPDDDGPWCRPDVWACGLTTQQMQAMTTVTLTGRYL